MNDDLFFLHADVVRQKIYNKSEIYYSFCFKIYTILEPKNFSAGFPQTYGSQFLFAGAMLPF